MLRRRSIPVTIVVLVFGSVLAAGGSASAAHVPATTSMRPGVLMHAFQPGGPMQRAAGSNASGRSNSTTTADSTNWSGYALSGTNGTFTSVSANWTEPAASCSGNSGGGGRHHSGSSDQYAAFWVGLDGYANQTVEQTGTDSDCDGTTPDYYGWYEMYPASPVYFTNTVAAGDSMSGSVTFSGTETYTLVLTDNTQGWTQTITVNKSGLARASAEAITEAPSSNSGVLPLADFGTISYGTATDQAGSFGTQNNIAITMVDSSRNDKDSTSSISSGGAFSNTWIRSS
jgi:hypothetical protein